MQYPKYALCCCSILLCGIACLAVLTFSAKANEVPKASQTRAKVIESFFGVSERRYDELADYFEFYMIYVVNEKIYPITRDLKEKRLQTNAQRESIEESVAKLLTEPLAHWTIMMVRSNIDENADVAAIGNLQDARRNDPRVDKLMRLFFDGSKEELERLRISVLQTVDIYLHKLSDSEIYAITTENRGMGSVIVLPELLRLMPTDKEHLCQLIQMFGRTKGNLSLVVSFSDPEGRLHQYMSLGVMGEILLYEIKMIMPHIETYSRQMAIFSDSERAELESFLHRSEKPSPGFNFVSLAQSYEQLDYITSESREAALTLKTLDVARHMCGMVTE